MPMPETWAEWLSRRTPHVRERLMRLNPAGGPRDGERIRGYHPRNPIERRMLTGNTSKGEFIRKHGREAWDAVPARALRKDGRRFYVSRFYMRDWGFA